VGLKDRQWLEKSCRVAELQSGRVKDAGRQKEAGSRRDDENWFIDSLNHCWIEGQKEI
jgi:hypothetical protein